MCRDGLRDLRTFASSDQTKKLSLGESSDYVSIPYSDHFAVSPLFPSNHDDHYEQQLVGIVVLPGLPATACIHLRQPVPPALCWPHLSVLFIPSPCTSPSERLRIRRRHRRTAERICPRRNDRQEGRGRRKGRKGREKDDRFEEGCGQGLGGSDIVGLECL